MYIAKKIQVTKNKATLIFGTETFAGHNIKHGGMAQDPIPVQIYNSTTSTVTLGTTTAAKCIYPLYGQKSISFGIIGETAIYGVGTTTASQTIYVLIGRQ